MWILCPDDGYASPLIATRARNANFPLTKSIVLLANVNNVIGRSPRGDRPVRIFEESISGSHAILTFSHDESRLESPPALSAVTLRDQSRFGCWVNGVPCKDTSRTLKEGDLLEFGGNRLARFYLRRRTTIVSLSAVSDASKARVRTAALRIGAHVISDWRRDVSTHLCMETISVTIKTISAMVALKPIVTPDFLEVCLRDAEAGGDGMVDVSAFLPSVTDSQLAGKTGFSFDINEKRRRIFAGKTFVFFDRKQFKKCFAVAEMGGATTRLVEKETGAPNSEFLVREEVVVMQPAVGDPSQSHALEVLPTLRRHSRRWIDTPEIGFAVIYCSAEKFTNPKVGDPLKDLKAGKSSALGRAENEETKENLSESGQCGGGSRNCEATTSQPGKTSTTTTTSTIEATKSSSKRDREDSPSFSLSEPVAMATNSNAVKTFSSESKSKPAEAVSVSKRGFDLFEPLTPENPSSKNSLETLNSQKGGVSSSSQQPIVSAPATKVPSSSNPKPSRFQLKRLLASDSEDEEEEPTSKRNKTESSEFAVRERTDASVASTLSGNKTITTTSNSGSNLSAESGESSTVSKTLDEDADISTYFEDDEGDPFDEEDYGSSQAEIQVAVKLSESTREHRSTSLESRATTASENAVPVKREVFVEDSRVPSEDGWISRSAKKFGGKSENEAGLERLRMMVEETVLVVRRPRVTAFDVRENDAPANHNPLKKNFKRFKKNRNKFQDPSRMVVDLVAVSMNSAPPESSESNASSTVNSTRAINGFASTNSDASAEFDFDFGNSTESVARQRRVASPPRPAPNRPQPARVNSVVAPQEKNEYFDMDF